MRKRVLIAGNIMTWTFCSLLSALCIPTVHAANDKPKSLYMRIKDLAEQEVGGDTSELAIQRFSLGVYHDSPTMTTAVPSGVVPLEITKEENADQSLQLDMISMCGSPYLSTDYGNCLAAQENIKEIMERNTWHRALGRELQTIASGYEMGIDGYPGKYIDVIPRISSIAQLWRAGNDPYIQPILEELTRARPWPKGEETSIQQTAQEIVEQLTSLVRTWTPAGGTEDDQKEDDTAMVAAIRRYRHGVEYVKRHEGDCANAPASIHLSDVWLNHRWCKIEDKMDELLQLIQKDKVELGTDEHVIYPSVIDKEQNIYIWMRDDDVGLQWYTPLEPMQAALYSPEYEDCLENNTPAQCYKQFGNDLVRGGEYPHKVTGINPNVSLGIEYNQEAFPPQGGSIDPTDDGAVVPEPAEGEGMCSHPFNKRGYLCRNITSENCNLTQAQKQSLTRSGTGGIVLTGCQPEQFKGDIATRSSGPNICGVGGWREGVANNMPKDTPAAQPDMQPSECSPCAVDIECSSSCGRGQYADTPTLKKQNGVINICIPEVPDVPGLSYYLMAHQLATAQQVCGESDLQSYERYGKTTDNPEEKAAACCSVEREAYFASCKLMALDGVLQRAGVSMDQCANALANIQCKDLDDTPGDNDYVCTLDGVNPDDINDSIKNTLSDMESDGVLTAPTTCAKAMDTPTMQAFYNSFPLSCSPGCQAKYQNTIGNNLCYAGQCLEETQEWARAHPGRMGLISNDEDFPVDSCDEPDPKLGEVDAMPAITGPTFPQYNPALLLQELDKALCQINGLPARTPPVICAFDPLKRLNLPPITYGQSVEDLALQPEQYDSTGLGIQYAAEGIGARITSDMFARYMRTGARNFADLLNAMHHLFKGVGDLQFPGTMCPRFASESFTCNELQR